MAQRLWWTAILVAGLLGTHALLRALRRRLAGDPGRRLRSPTPSRRASSPPSAASPPRRCRRCWRRSCCCRWCSLRTARIGPRRAAALSGLAVLACGGVNATATVLAAVPTGLWLVTRSGGGRARSPGGGSAADGVRERMVAGAAARSSAATRRPFLDWIESSADVVRTVDAVDVLRGTTHWLEDLVTAAGPWWPAGHALETVPVTRRRDDVLAALGVAGILLPGTPERRWLWGCAALGAFVILVGHPGPVSSPFAGEARSLLDGPLAPLRNVHKADPLVRLPLAVGLAHALTVLERSLRPRRVARAAALAGVGLAALGAVSPGLTGAIAPPGGYREIAPQWVEAGAWLSERAGTGRALVVPAASFGEYDWGRPIDEPLRALSTIDQAVRDAVPLTPAGTIRFLDDVEHRLQEGAPLGGEVEVLRRLGVRWLVLRNDLDATVAGQPPVALARSAVRTSEGVALAKGFGKTRLDASGERVFPVEVYDVGSAAPVAVTQPTDSVVGVAGGAEDLARVLESGSTGLVVLDGDRPPGLDPGRRVVTDGYRARDRWFGASRGRDASSTLSAAEVPGTTDYRPWPDDAGFASHVLWGGVRDVRASSSLATDYTIAGLRPAERPAAALDADPRTAWTTLGDERPTLEVDLVAPRPVGSVHLEAFVPEGTAVRVGRGGGQQGPRHHGRRFGRGRPRRPGSSRRGAPRRCHGPRSGGGAGDRPRAAPHGCSPASPRCASTGVAPLEVVALPASADAARHGPADAVVLDAGLPGSSACVRPRSDVVCLGAGALAPEGGADLGALPARRRTRLLQCPGDARAGTRAAGSPASRPTGVSVEASSSRTDASTGSPGWSWTGTPRRRGARRAVTAPRSSPCGSPDPSTSTPFGSTRGGSGCRGTGPSSRSRSTGGRRRCESTTRGSSPCRGPASAPSACACSSTSGPSLPPGLELAELQVLGADLPRPAEQLDWPCGPGRRLSVDGAAGADLGDRPAVGAVGGRGGALAGVRAGRPRQRSARGRAPRRRRLAAGTAVLERAGDPATGYCPDCRRPPPTTGRPGSPGPSPTVRSGSSR